MASKANKNFINIKLKLSFGSLPITLGHWVNLLFFSDLWWGGVSMYMNYLDMDSFCNGHGFGWTPGVGDGQGGLACCSSWGHKESE